MGGAGRFLPARRERVAVAGLIALTLVAPILGFGLFARQLVESDLAAQRAAERLRYAELAGRLVDQSLREVGAALDIFVTRRLLQEALLRRDATELSRHLRNLRAGGHASAAAFDARGIVLAVEPPSPENIGRDFSGRDYFRGGIESSSSYVSEVFSSARAGNPTVVAVAHAVRRGDELVGLVLISLSPARILEALEPLQGAPGRELILLDKRTQVVASTSPDRAALSVLELPGYRDAVTGRSGTVTADLDGQERLVTYAPVAGAEWALYVVDDPAVVLAAEQRLGATLGLATLLAVLIVGVSAAAVAALYAVTERQRAALARLNEELAVAGRHKSEFLSNMSHELRTPLNAVLGFSDLLQEQLGAALTDRQRRYLRNIHDAGAHLLELINDVLDLAKVEAGRLELRPEMLRLRALLEPTLAAARVAAVGRGVAFAADFPAEARVRLDPGRARQILYNLLSNAVKFTPAGGRVSLAARVDGTALVFEVADTGIGIPAAARDRVFGTFERLHEGRSEASGTGLGLALTKRIVEAHAGTIDFESAIGEGTTFRVRLPDAALPPEVREHVLVVEDEPRDAELIVALAAQVGLDCEIVRTADEALAEARGARPLGVVLDLRLPDGRGERVLRELKADPAMRAIPVVVVTIEDEGTGLRADGADDYLVKPIDRGRLLAWLRLLAERRAARDAAAAG